MDMPAPRDLLERTLERAAHDIGDLTAPVMSLFHRRFPEARAAFERLWADRADALEADMVGNALYCLMTWLESRTEIEIMLESSVPHHARTLRVPREWYAGLMDCTIEVIRGSVPPEAGDEHALLNGLAGDLETTIAASL